MTVSGYLIGSQEAGRLPLPPEAELQRWYQYYFATDRAPGMWNRRDFARLTWRSASPKWSFDEATFDGSAASFDNPDHVAIVIHNYRWRIGVADDEPEYLDLEKRCPPSPLRAMPTAHPIQNRAPTPRSSPGRIRTHHRRRRGAQPPAGSPDAFAETIRELGDR